MAMTDQEKITWILACREEASQAKIDRMRKNKSNYEVFHLEHDFSHKKAGQSTEVLSKQSMAVEQTKSFFQQALADIGEWWKADVCYPESENAMPIKAHEITKMTNYQLEKSKYFSHVGNSLESALLASLAISKTSGYLEKKPRFVSKKKGRGKVVEKIEDTTWRIEFTDVRAENFYPDPKKKRGLYVIEDMWEDYHEVAKLAAGEDAIYDSATVSALSRAGTSDAEEETKKARETGQNTTISGHRPKVKLTEFWGTIINPTTGEVEDENCVATIANDTIFIRKPEDNPNWNQKHPYTYSPLMEVSNSVWHKAPMDAPTCHNMALTELYNLLMDAAFQQVNQTKQLRKDFLDNPAQVADGIVEGETLIVNSGLPIGGKVLESLSAVEIPQQALNIFNIMAQEFNASAMTNDLRQGVMPFRAVKATEVVEASQTITSVFQGMAKNYEVNQSMPELELAWQMTAQNWDQISKEEFVSLFGAERGEELSQLDPADVFTSTVNGIRFKVFGISLTLSKSADFRKLTQLLQVVSASPHLLEQFVAKYDLGKLLAEIMTALDIDKEKIEIPLAVQKTMQEGQEGQQGGGAPAEQPEGNLPNQQSQVPQPGAGSLSDMMGTPQFPHAQFPGSPATKGQ